jgi:hypothetical protein
MNLSNSKCQYVYAGGLRGRYLDGVWCCSLPSFWSRHFSNIEIGLEIHGTEATRSAYPSSCFDEGQLYC